MTRGFSVFGRLCKTCNRSVGPSLAAQPAALTWCVSFIAFCLMDASGSLINLLFAFPPPRTICREPPLRETQGRTSSEPTLDLPQSRASGSNDRGGEPVDPQSNSELAEPAGRRIASPERECGDSPCEIIFSVKTLWTPLAAISRGKCSELPATLWSTFSTEIAHGIGFAKGRFKWCGTST